MNRRLLLALPLLALASVALWRLSRPAGGVLRVAVSEGRVLLETKAGSLEVPAGSTAAGGRATVPSLLAEASAGEEWRAPLAGEATRDTKPAEPEWKKALGEKMKQTVHLQFDGIPFRDAKAYLETTCGVTINVDRAAREAAAGLDDLPMTFESPPEGMELGTTSRKSCCRPSRVLLSCRRVVVVARPRSPRNLQVATTSRSTGGKAG